MHISNTVLGTAAAAILAGVLIGVGTSDISIQAPSGASTQRAPELSDGQIRQGIIHASIADYQADGRPCACPFNLMRNGRQCGNSSAYSKPGGASPLCYDKDVSDAMVRDWRRRH
jgi:hypothetical protein